MTDYITWKAYYSVGDESLDAEHKIIIKMINELYPAVVSGGDDDRVRGILDRLLLYTDTHCKHEEQLMRECEFPELKEHELLHEQLRQRTVELCNKRNHPSGQELLQFLKDCWSEHIQEQDKAFGRYLQATLEQPQPIALNHFRWEGNP